MGIHLFRNIRMRNLLLVKLPDIDIKYEEWHRKDVAINKGDEKRMIKRWCLVEEVKEKESFITYMLTEMEKFRGHASNVEIQYTQLKKFKR